MKNYNLHWIALYLAGKYPPFFQDVYSKVDFNIELRTITSNAITREVTDEMKDTAKTDEEFFYMGLHRLHKISEWKDLIEPFLRKLDIKLDEIDRKVIYTGEDATGSEKITRKLSYSGEEEFTEELLVPLFRKLGYEPIYNHWIREYWKDIILSRCNGIGVYEYIWVPVKYGDVSWTITIDKTWKKVRQKNWSKKKTYSFDELKKQAEKSFKMPFEDINTKEKHYISQVFVVISWSFTDNAKEEMMEITPPALRNNLFFIDWAKIDNLIEIANKA